MNNLMIFLMLASVGFTKSITISNHLDKADTFKTEDIIEVCISGESLFVYYYKVLDNTIETGFKQRKHEQFMFDSFDDAYEEMKYLAKEMK